MKLLRIKSLWGMDGTLDSQISEIVAAGYHGVEAGLPHPDEASRFRELLRDHQLAFIAQVFTSGNHVESLKEQVEQAATYGPLFINAHSAKDAMPYAEQVAFFSAALDLERAVGIPMAHETHRGRAMFTPWTTAMLLRELPELKITADFSHWCNACESMLHDQTDNVALAIEHSIHIHGRVGYEEGPQVPDFRAPEYEYALTQHESWWDAIWQARLSEGRPFLTFTPEFGPPGYMHTLPYTRQPVANLWDLCLAMMNRFASRHETQESSSAM